MTNASPRVAVVATQLAQTDRRALSQAWYSALHLAERSGPQVRAERAASAAQPQRSRTKPMTETPRPPSDALAHVRGAARESAARGAAEERRRPPCEAGRRVERAIARLVAARPPVSAQTVDVAAGRVRLLVRRSGGTTRIVAVCPPVLRETVERALAHARFALAAAGVEVAWR